RRARARIPRRCTGRAMRTAAQRTRAVGLSQAFSQLARLGQEGVDLVVGRVEVRRDAHAGAGAVVAEALAVGQLLGDGAGAGEVEADAAAATGGLAGRAQGPAGGVDGVDDEGGLAQ